MSVDAVFNRIEAEASEGTGGTKEEFNSLEFLQSIYRNSQIPLPVRMRAAIETLPFEKPKLTAQANVYMDGKSFGELLDKAIARSHRPLLIEAQPTEHPPVELKPMPRLRRRI